MIDYETGISVTPAKPTKTHFFAAHGLRRVLVPALNMARTAMSRR